MAINQQPLSQSITLPTQTVSGGQGFNQLAAVTSQIGQLVTERLNEVAIDQASMQGVNDVADGNQPETLSLPFTKATKAYNKAVAETEAQRMLISGEQLINESLANSKNPATFTGETPAKFKAELDGIKSGILQNARAETREYITEHLDKMANSASLSMLQHSIAYDNEKTNFDFQHDMSGLLESRRNAAIAGDMDRVNGIDLALNSTLANYSTMNAGIAQKAPYYKQDIEKHQMIDGVLHGYSTAQEEGTTSVFLSNLTENKDKLPFNVWQDAVKGVVALDQEHKRLKNDINAEQVAQVNLGINNGSIQDAADILNYPELTVPQKLTAMKQLDTVQAKQMKQGAQLITAQQNILSGRPEFNKASIRDQMFQNQVQAMQQQTGQPPSLVDMEQSVLGLNEFPASGLPSTPMGTNVPAFDSAMQGSLTGGDIAATAQAAMVFNDMVNIKQQPNSVNLTGDALAVATLFGELYQGGITPEQASEQAINTVLHAKEPEVAQRIDRFHKTLEKTNPSTGQQDVMRSKFKQAFDLAPQAFGSDEAFRVFKDIYRSNYISSNSEEGAFKATKYAMQKWGTSKYFDKGFVGQPVPEKEVPIANIASAFPNQILSNVQGYINRTNAAREAHPDLNIPMVEWVNPEQTITGNESEQDKVFKNMTIGSHPRIKINGHETDVVLMPSASSRLGDGGVNYLLGVYDQFNNLHPLKDVTNPVDQVARFSPQELSLWTPGIATQKMDDEIRGYALKVQEREMQPIDEKFNRENPAWAVILGLVSTKVLRDHNLARAAQSSSGRLDEIVASLKGEPSSAETRDAITVADNVGISTSLEPKR